MIPEDWIRTFQRVSLTLYVIIRHPGQGTRIYKLLSSYNYRGMREFWENECAWGKSVSSKIKVCVPIWGVLPWVLLLWMLCRSTSELSEPAPVLAMLLYKPHVVIPLLEIPGNLLDFTKRICIRTDNSGIAIIMRFFSSKILWNSLALDNWG